MGENGEVRKKEQIVVVNETNGQAHKTGYITLYDSLGHLKNGTSEKTENYFIHYGKYIGNG